MPACARSARLGRGLGFIIQGIVESPITGPEGNVEFLISAYRSAETGIEQVTEKAES
jgi:predicted rRNA methylase YqxC with S4 and FtsJ domains